MASKASLENALRSEVLEVVISALAEYYDLDRDTQISVVGPGEIAIPLVDAEGNEKYPKIKISIPRGTRNGEGGYIPYNGEDAAREYAQEKADKAQEKAVKKAMKEAEKKGNK